MEYGIQETIYYCCVHEYVYLFRKVLLIARHLTLGRLKSSVRPLLLCYNFSVHIQPAAVYNLLFSDVL
jgi:hypothetical protein